MTTNNSILIFHRSKNNSEEDLINQQKFLESHKAIFSPANVIDYVSGDYHGAKKLFNILESSMNTSIRATAIINGFLSEKDYHNAFDLYNYLKFFKGMDKLAIYLMDSEGKLYKEIESIE
jgi:hypothetical protein